MQAAPALYGTQEPLNQGPDYFDYFLCVCVYLSCWHMENILHSPVNSFPELCIVSAENNSWQEESRNR